MVKKPVVLSHQEIVRLTGISPNTLRKYLQDYVEGGIEKLKEINFNRPTSKLTEHQQKIEDYFRTNPPASINEAIVKIEELTGIKRSPTQVRIFLKSIGMRCLKVAKSAGQKLLSGELRGFVPGKADPDVQAEFKKKERVPRLEEAKIGKRAVFFMVASHFVMGAFLGWVWCFQRIFIKSPSGRKRFNVLGALNALPS